jgi:hypothetical protein
MQGLALRETIEAMHNLAKQFNDSSFHLVLNTFGHTGHVVLHSL